MLAHPNCKINLGLQVVGRRPDGYHNLQTLFVPIPLADDLSISPATAFAFRQSGIAIGGDPEQNLVVRAYRLLQTDFPSLVGPVEIELCKHIPFGAGLGGGSADAAFALKLIAQLFGLPLSAAQLEGYASRLGADCAFFIQNRAAYATGIGDQLQPVDLDLTPYHILLVKPEDAVSTAEAYRNLRVDFDAPRPDLREAVKAPIAQWRKSIVNDFEASVFPAHPHIAQCKETLYRSGAAYASMTGSGAALFALYDELPSPLPAFPFPVEVLYAE